MSNRFHWIILSLIIIIILFFVLYRFGWDTLQKAINTIGSFSIVVALLTYFYTKSQNKILTQMKKTNLALGQISFFRRNVMPKWNDKVVKIIKSKNKDYMFSQIGIEVAKIGPIKKKYPKNFKDQVSIFLNDLDNLELNSEIYDSRILDSQIELFNMLEEFSTKVNQLGISNHQALKPVHHVFVQIVEKNAVSLVFVRDVIAGNSIYSETLSLYQCWKKGVKKTNKKIVIERLRKYGFLSRENSRKIIEKMKESYEQRFIKNTK